MHKEQKELRTIIFENGGNEDEIYWLKNDLARADELMKILTTKAVSRLIELRVYKTNQRNLFL